MLRFIRISYIMDDLNELKMFDEFEILNESALNLSLFCRLYAIIHSKFLRMYSSVKGSHFISHLCDNKEAYVQV